MKTYIIGGAAQQKTAPLFDSTGFKLYSRHPECNTRIQASAILDFAQTYLKKGYQYQFCGPMFAVAPRESLNPRAGEFWLIGGGTRAASWYHAIDTTPENTYCIAAIRAVIIQRSFAMFSARSILQVDRVDRSFDRRSLDRSIGRFDRTDRIGYAERRRYG